VGSKAFLLLEAIVGQTWDASIPFLKPLFSSNEFQVSPLLNHFLGNNDILV
jgi:hypothetical protein